MAIHSEHNLYPGVNIHLNSILQNQPGIWQSFHAEHIIRLREEMDAKLPAGYFTLSEASLQIGEFDAVSSLETRSKTRPDVTVYRNPAITQQSGTIAAEEVATPTILLPIPDTLFDEDTLTGLVVYQGGEGSLLGRPITRVELLSPANKPGGTHYGQYKLKRTQTLKSGLRLVEIDYFHQLPPIVPVPPSHPTSPYRILVSDPRPTLEEGKAAFYDFHVDQALPVIDIPLAGADVVRVNFGAAYNRTFESSRFFVSIVDYSSEPIGIGTYNEVDQMGIHKRLAQIRQKEE